MFVETIKAGGTEIGKFQDSFWLKVFFHNSTGNIKFKDPKEALHCDLPQKYSILDTINSNMKTNGKYEFIIEYPNEVYYQWRQTKNPIYEYEILNKNEATGFDLIHKGNDYNMSGLVRSTLEVNGYINSLLDGNPGNSYWYFAIGMYEDIIDSYLNADIPAYGKTVNFVKLWLKIDPKK